VTSTYRELRHAVLRRLVLAATYDGLPRTFCPYCLGSTENTELVFVLQIGGLSSRGSVNPDGEWKCFRVDRLFEIQAVNEQWREGPHHSGPQTCVREVDVSAGERPNFRLIE